MPMTFRLPPISAIIQGGFRFRLSPCKFPVGWNETVTTRTTQGSSGKACEMLDHPLQKLQGTVWKSGTKHPFRRSPQMINQGETPLGAIHRRRATSAPENYKHFEEFVLAKRRMRQVAICKYQGAGATFNRYPIWGQGRRSSQPRPTYLVHWGS